MIETPAKAPPPDPRLREPDPPPDPGSRYEHACVECGTPLHADQAACLNCGTMVELGDGGAGIRRAALGSVTALLVLGGAVGAAVAGLPHGKHVPKPAVAKVFGTKQTPPPATAGSNGSGASPVTPLADGGTASKPPAITPEKPHKVKSPAANTHSSSSNTNSSTNSTGGTKSKKKKKKSKPKPKPLALFEGGAFVAEAGEFTSSGPAGSSGATDQTIDNNAKTAWTKKRAGSGIMVTPNSPPYTGLGIVSALPGYGVKVYFTNESPPPSSVADWKPVTSTTSAGRHWRVNFPTTARNADRYLVMITGLPAGGKVSINEIQLFQ
jgi:hypothetical protein